MQILGFVNQSPVQQKKEKKMIYKKYKERKKERKELSCAVNY